MAHNPTGAYKLFKTVIDDTINNVRDAFLDEGVDEQILQELKQIWETKLVQSRAVDTGVPQQPHHVQSYQELQAAAAAQQAQQAQTQAKAQAKQAAQTQRQQQQQQQQGAHQTTYVASSSNPTQQLGSTLTPQAAAATLALPQGVLQLQPHQIAQLQAGLTLPPGVTVGGQQFPAYQVQGGSGNLSGFQLVHQPVIQQTNQAGQVQPGQVITFTTQGGAQGSVLQVDGGNDTSDEEDDFDDDDNDDDDDEREERDGEVQNDVEEEPLNSDDDVSDEDPAELFDTDNVVVCQYDRINRNRNKWKFNLKSGIMNLKGKDHVFFKANGDAEW